MNVVFLVPFSAAVCMSWPVLEQIHGLSPGLLQLVAVQINCRSLHLRGVGDVYPEATKVETHLPIKAGRCRT